MDETVATTPRSARRHRLEVRVSPAQDALIRQAAELEGTTVSAFVLDTVAERAAQVVDSHRDVLLSDQAYARFLAELDAPAVVVQELVSLFGRPVLPTE
ncbi:MAG: type II toxin-antitoxin system TacA family antitoxin [Sporichthyaceae bacterium]